MAGSFYRRLAHFRVAFARVQTYVGILTFFLVFATFATAVYDSPRILVVRENIDFVSFFFLSLAAALVLFAAIALLDLRRIYRAETAWGASFNPMNEVTAWVAACAIADREAEGRDVGQARERMRACLAECGMGERFDALLEQARR